MIMLRAMGVGLLLSGVAAAEPSDAPLLDEVYEDNAPGTSRVESMTRVSLRAERVWLDDQRPTLGDLVRPSIFLAVGTGSTVFGVWALAEFMKMTPAYRENAEWLAIGTILVGVVLSASMGALIGWRARKRSEYQERITAIRRESLQRDQALKLSPPPPPSPEPPNG